MKENTTRTVAIYCRVARKCTYGIDSQLADLKQFAHDLGFYELTYYIDNGVSGSTLDRPGFRQMEAAIQAGTIRAVIAKDISRIGPDVCKVGCWLEELKSKGIPFFTVNHPCELPLLPTLESIYRFATRQERKKSE